MVGEASHESDVAGSNPTGRVSREFFMKNAATCALDGDGQALASGGLLRKKILFFSGFFVSSFAECGALGNRVLFCRVFFAECI